MKKICFLVALFGLMATQSQAAKPFVRCVQNQLVSLGQDLGPIDGALGKRTRAALAKVVSENQQLKELPQITNRFSVTWCRELGALGFRTRAHLPYYDGLVFKSDLAASSEIDAFVKQQMKDLHIWYGAKFGVRLATRPTIVIAQSGKSAIALARTAAKETGVKQIGKKSIRAKCNGPKTAKLPLLAQTSYSSA